MDKKTEKFLDVTVRAVEDQPRTYWFVASTQSRDREGDVIVQGGWKFADFMKNPVVLWTHNYYSTPIGRVLEIKMEEKRFSAKIEFIPAEIDPFAGMVEQEVQGGWLRTVSVGFMVYKTEQLTPEEKAERPEMEWGRRLYGDLLEISLCSVPANPQALRERGFQELMKRSFDGGSRPEEKESDRLPYRDQDGKISPRMLKASLAALMGARGGVGIPFEQRTAHMNHLYRIAKENTIELPDAKDLAPDTLKRHFNEVWHEELIDVISRAEEKGETGEMKLLMKGKTREQIVATRDALNAVLDLTAEPEAPAAAADKSGQAETLNTIQSIVTDLAATTAALK